MFDMTRTALAATALAMPVFAHAELWGYVDGSGTAHLAPTQVDSRYHLVLGDAAQGRVPGKTDGAGGLLTWLEFAPEVKSLQPLLREAAAAHGVDIELLKAIIAVESGFNAKAVSPRGAIGLMQLTPIAAQHYGGFAAGERPAALRDKLLDPRTNILTGARMLSNLTRRFGRIDVALAAWNAGESAVRKAGGEMPAIPETQAHVHLVLELYWALLQARMPSARTGLQMHGAAASDASR
jgi:hypothetical protein